LGVGFPLGVMMLYDMLNNRISSDSKILERKLKIPFGGVLVKNHRGEHIAIRENENSVSSELFRTLRTNLRFMQPIDSTCPTILVTSSINGEGKSYVAQKIMENVMNPYINPQASEYFLVNCEFEMNPVDLLLRRINRETGRSIRDILLKKQTKLEDAKIAEILQKETNPNIVYIPQPCSAQEFEEAVAMVCEAQKDKKLVIFK
jgi:hypothetical protein